MTGKSKDAVEIDMGVIDEAEDVVADNAPADAVDEASDEIATLPRGATENADRSVTVELDTPITLTIKNSKTGGQRQETYDQLKFHRLTGKDLTEISNAAPGVRDRVAFAVSARMNKAIMNALFDRLDAADIERCGRVIQYFLGSGQKTGRS